MKTLIKNGIVAATAASVLSVCAVAAEMPGEGVKVYPLQSSIVEEKFQAMIVNRALEELGYDVQPIKEASYPVVYQTISQNKDADAIYYTPTNWDPLHDSMYEKAGGDDVFYKEGTYVAGCAQGYLIDKKTAQKHDIKYINDLSDPKIAKLFDSDDDGKADLAGCKPGWGCEQVIEHQLDAFKLRDNIEHNQGEYSAIIAETISKYKKGEPILYYTWTPYWVSGKLVPGKDVVWLQVTRNANPNVEDTSLPNGENYGFAINSQHIVANGSIAKKHPAAAKLFEVAKVHVNDISQQNMLVSKGENSEKEIARHANSWIKANKETFDGWIEAAKKAAK